MADNYTPMEKLVLALLSASKRFKRYFQAHTVVVITNQPIKQLLSSSEISGRMLKWKFELEGYDVQYRPRTAIKGQILADFIVERPEEESPDELMAEPEVLPEPWTLFTDGSSCVDGSGAGLILTNPEGTEVRSKVTVRCFAMVTIGLSFSTLALSTIFTLRGSAVRIKAFKSISAKDNKEKG
ncbi:reverse transcriptase domain-containing protein [Tanacetum coccineum]